MFAPREVTEEHPYTATINLRSRFQISDSFARPIDYELYIFHYRTWVGQRLSLGASKTDVNMSPLFFIMPQEVQQFCLWFDRFDSGKRVGNYLSVAGGFDPGLDNFNDRQYLVGQIECANAYAYIEFTVLPEKVEESE